MPGVRTLAVLVSQQIDSAETRRAQHLRPLCRVRDLHRRIDAAGHGLARLVHSHARKEKESGGDEGSHSDTHQSREAVAIARASR